MTSSAGHYSWIGNGENKIDARVECSPATIISCNLGTLSQLIILALDTSLPCKKWHQTATWSKNRQLADRFLSRWGTVMKRARAAAIRAPWTINQRSVSWLAS
jgi:hypothetical protein